MRRALAIATGNEAPTPMPAPLTVQRPGETQVLPAQIPPGPPPPAQIPPGPPPPAQISSGPFPPAPPPVRPGPPLSSGHPPRGAARPGAFPSPPGRAQARPMAHRPGHARVTTRGRTLAGLGIGALVVAVGIVAARTLFGVGGSPGSAPTPTVTYSLIAATSTPRPSPSPGAVAQGSLPGPGAPVAPIGASPAAPIGASPPAAPGGPAPGTPGPTPVTGLANAIGAEPSAVGAPASSPQPGGPAPSPPAPAKPTNPPGVFLSDSFENAEIGQLPRVSARPDDYTFAYDDGEYVIRKINEKLPAAPIVFLPGSYDNTVIGVDVRIVGDAGSRYAFVVCRDQSSGGQAKQYRASIVPEGRRLILSRWDEGSQRVLAETRDDGAINPGNATNRLELTCSNAKISAAVNGKTLVSADDMTLSRGDQGIGAGTFAGVDGTLEAHFDNLEIRAP
jgi:hypothetical protein